MSQLTADVCLSAASVLFNLTNDDVIEEPRLRPLPLDLDPDVCPEHYREWMTAA